MEVHDTAVAGMCYSVWGLGIKAFPPVFAGCQLLFAAFLLVRVLRVNFFWLLFYVGCQPQRKQTTSLLGPHSLLWSVFFLSVRDIFVLPSFFPHFFVASLTAIPIASAVSFQEFAVNPYIEAETIVLSLIWSKTMKDVTQQHVYSVTNMSSNLWHKLPLVGKCCTCISLKKCH